MRLEQLQEQVNVWLGRCADQAARPELSIEVRSFFLGCVNAYAEVLDLLEREEDEQTTAWIDSLDPAGGHAERMRKLREER